MGRFEGGQWSEGGGKSTASDSFNNSIWDLSDLVILATVICRSRNKNRNTVDWDLSNLVSLSTVIRIF